MTTKTKNMISWSLTAIVGFILIGKLILATYMGGKTETYLEHGQSIIALKLISALVWLTTTFRFRVLTTKF